MHNPPFVRSPFNYDVKKASDEAATIPVGESLTVQSQTEDTDINVLMMRQGITGVWPTNPRLPEYGDFTEVRDFRSALEAVRAGAEAFNAYPAHFRARFQNDPQLFLEFCQDPANIPEMKSLGMFKPEVSNVDRTGGRAGAEAGAASGGGAPQRGNSAGSANASPEPGGSPGQAQSAAVVQGA